jgi:hypothetical protein
MYRSYMDQTLAYFDRPHVGPPTRPVRDVAAWRSIDLTPTQWTVELSIAERAWFADTGASVAGNGRPLAELARSAIPAAPVEALVDRCRSDLGSGLGFVLLRGVPVESMNTPEVEAAFWALGLLLGQPGAQNGEGDLLGHVTDYHDDPDTPLSREYRTTVDIDFHCDAADVVGLLCLAEASSGGESRLVSSVTVANELVARAPELAARLSEEVELDTRSDGAGFDHVPVRPMCFAGDRVRTFMHVGYFRSAARHDDVELDADLVAALDEWSKVASDPTVHLDMELRPGDIQLCSNHTVAHARRSYVDDPAAPRHLLRLWLTL